MGIDVAGYLSEQQRKSSPDLAQEFAALEEFYNKKLWHQLTLRVTEFIRNPALSQGDALVKLYQNFIADFEHRINPLALAEIVIVVCRQIKDVKEAIEFLEVTTQHEVHWHWPFNTVSWLYRIMCPGSRIRAQVRCIVLNLTLNSTSGAPNI